MGERRKARKAKHGRDGWADAMRSTERVMAFATMSRLDAFDNLAIHYCVSSILINAQR